MMAELENLANKGREEGFIGLEEITDLHKQKGINLYFQGIRPKEMHIKYAKSGEIDALIREVAKKNNEKMHFRSCMDYLPLFRIHLGCLSFRFFLVEFWYVLYCVKVPTKCIQGASDGVAQGRKYPVYSNPEASV